MSPNPEKMAPLQTLPLGAIRPDGWMRVQLLRDLAEGFASRLDSLTTHASRDLFRQRIETSAEQFAWWDAETRGNWLWGYTLMAFLADDEWHKARVTALLHDLKATQDADGYLGIYSPQSRYQHGESENGELWAQSRALLALLTYYEFTGDPAFLQSVEAAAQLTMRHYGAHQRHYPVTGDPLHHLIGVTHGLNYVDVMAWLYEITGNPAYRDFGVWLYDDFNTTTIPFVCDDLALTNLLNPHRGFGNHSAHTAEHLRVLAWSAAVTGRADLAQAMQAARYKLEHCLLPSGALMGDEGIHGLPLPDMGYEYCTSTELMLSLATCLQLMGDSLLGDQVENIVFNAAQGARLADGTGVAYLSQDTRLDTRASRHDSYSHLHHIGGRFKYSPTHEDVACCCNPNSTRLLPHYISRMWMRLPDDRGLVAMQYGACRVKTDLQGVPITIKVITDYPFTETISVVVSVSQPLMFRLGLRKPAWAKAIHVQVDGAAISEESGYLFLEKTWGTNEQVIIRFETAVQVVPYPNGEYAVRRGALQYVYPITPRVETLKTYSGSDLCDTQAIPHSLEQAYTPIILSAMQADYGLTFQPLPAADLHHPWDHAPVGLVSGELTLVPMGCTLLRRAAFPIDFTELESEPN